MILERSGTVDRIQAHERMITTRGRILSTLGILGLLGGIAQYVWNVLPIPALALVLTIGGLALLVIGLWQFIWLARVHGEARAYTRSVLDLLDRMDSDS
jgi:hypothetical protein